MEGSSEARIRALEAFARRAAETIEALTDTLKEQQRQTGLLAAHLAQFTTAFENVWKRLDEIDGAQPVPLYLHEHDWQPVQAAVWENAAGVRWAQGYREVCACGAARHRMERVGTAEEMPA